MAGRLAGRRAVVTGAGRGLGRATVLALAADGAHVVAVSRTQADLDGVAADVRAAGGTIDVATCDVTDAAAFAAVLEALGPVDVLVNNAGVNAPMAFLDVDAATYDRLLDVNVRAAFFCAQAAARQMVAHGQGGVIVNVSSQMGHVGAANRTVYCAAKHAIEGLTKALAVELGPEGIRVVSVAPTYVETELTASSFADPAFRAAALGAIPLGRFGQAAEVAAAIAFAASEDAALLTGSSLLLDGGYVAR